jgi:hypothetical protein
MADLFISYAREDVSEARGLHRFLALQGWSVWWDKDLYVGKPFEERLFEVLDSAKCVVVLWSESSVHREFVLREAQRAKAQGKLVGARIGEVGPPEGLGDRCVGLDRPIEEGQHHGDLLGAIRTLVDRAPDILVLAQGPSPETVRVVDEALRDAAWTVWWAHYFDRFDTGIDLRKAGDVAKCVVPVWSSRELSPEAMEIAVAASERNRLVPLVEKGAVPPATLQSIHAERLEEVSGGGGKFEATVRAKLDAPEKFHWWLKVTTPILLLVSLASLIGAYRSCVSPTWMVHFGLGLDTREATLEKMTDAWLPSQPKEHYWIVEWLRALLLVFFVRHLLANKFSKECLWILRRPRWKPPFQAAPVIRLCRRAFWAGLAALVYFVVAYHTDIGPTNLEEWVDNWGIEEKTAKFNHWQVHKGAEPTREYKTPYLAYAPYSAINYLVVLVTAFTVLSASLADSILVRSNRSALDAKHGMWPYAKDTSENMVAHVKGYGEELIERFRRYATVVGGVALFFAFEECLGWKTLADLATGLRWAAIGVFVWSLLALLIIYRRYNKVFDSTATFLRESGYAGAQEFARGNGFGPLVQEYFNHEGPWIVTTILLLLIVGIVWMCGGGTVVWNLPWIK